MLVRWAPILRLMSAAMTTNPATLRNTSCPTLGSMLHMWRAKQRMTLLQIRVSDAAASTAEGMAKKKVVIQDACGARSFGGRTQMSPQIAQDHGGACSR